MIKYDKSWITYIETFKQYLNIMHSHSNYSILGTIHGAFEGLNLKLP